MELLTNSSRQAIEERDRFAVALTGGRTAAQFYPVVASTGQSIDWSRADFFWGDERCVSPDHEQSNFRLAHQTLLVPLNIKSSQIHRIEADRHHLDVAASDYQREIANRFGCSASGPPPAFDLILLSMGDDGHIASLFPGTKALDETKRWVVPNEVPKLSSWRMTLTFPILNRARKIVVFVTGSSKAAALQAVHQGKFQPAQLPSQALELQKGQLHWLVDAAAACQLKLST